MNVIVFRDTSERPIRLNLSRRQWLAATAGSLALLFALAGGLGFALGGKFGWERTRAEAELDRLASEIARQQQTLAQLGRDNDRTINALALRLGEMKARTVRLEALGRRLTQMGQLDDGEFDFNEPPALGGPGLTETGDPGILEPIDLDSELSQLSQRLEHQGQQLSVLETLIANRELEETLEPAGKPVAKGWLSSYFGKRADPFTGQPDYHPGIDFTGPPDTDIVAVAGGVVVWSGRKPDYGLTVDIDHGNGYVTRYAHNEANHVAVGDRVLAGQVIGTMGSTGRSTSRHVHFEVWYQGHRINPYDVVTAGR